MTMVIEAQQIDNSYMSYDDYASFVNNDQDEPFRNPLKSSYGSRTMVSKGYYF